MRRIRIENHHVSLADEYKNKLIKGETNNGIKIEPVVKLTKLKEKLENGKVKVGRKIINKSERDNLKKMLTWIEDNCKGNLFNGIPSQLSNIIKDFTNKFQSVDLSEKIAIGKNKAKKIATLLCETMQYQEIRQHIMPEYIRKMGIKTCCYCNANYTITDENNIGYYQLDHWKPKSKYPFLCISFFNLQPCCASCNQHKGNDDEGGYFNLYAEDPMPLDVFRFNLPEENRSLYLVDHNPIHLKTEWYAIDKNNDTMVNDMEAHLHISNIYKEHCDVVEELLWKQIFYKDAFLDAFNQSKLGITLMENDINRLIIGTYSKPEDIHKRPLTKMRQDIARQLEIIKD